MRFPAPNAGRYRALFGVLAKKSTVWMSSNRPKPLVFDGSLSDMKKQSGSIDHLCEV
jgi:hypothetical protein